MNVSLKNNDPASGVLKVEIEKKDYAEQLKKNLQSLRQKVNMPGFRKGMVPPGMVKKLYGKQVLAEEVNKLVSEKIMSYIKDNDVKILGEPIPNETEQKPIDFNREEDFEFLFDIALAPQINVALTKKDKLTYFQIKMDDELADKQIEMHLRRFGSYDTADEAEVEDMLKGTVSELEEGAPKEGGIVVEDAVLMPLYMKTKTEQEKFIGAKTNHKITFNPYKAYKGTEAEIASFLKIDKEKVKETKSDFTFEIKEITRHKKAELNQELYDRVFGENAVKDEAEFRDKVKALLQEQYTSQSEYRFINDMRTMLIDKTKEVVFADDILKRWLLISNEKVTQDMVEHDYPEVLADLKYHLVKEKLVKENEIKVEKEELEDLARRVAKAHFAQYGMLTAPDNLLNNYVKEMLEKQETVNKLIDRVISGKLAAVVKDKITVTTKEVTAEEFDKIMTEQQSLSEKNEQNDE